MNFPEVTIRASERRTWPRAAVLDCDGLLVDTERFWHAAYRTAAEAAGSSLNGLDLAQFDGGSVHSAAEQLTAALGRTVSKRVLGEALHRGLATRPVRAMRGAEQLLRALADHVPLAVASNAPAASLRTALDRSGLRRYLSLIVSAEHRRIYKPLPDVYLEACRRLKIDPSDAIAFEDSAVGAQAARAAGLTVIVVPSGPSARRYGDLVVPSLDDARVFELFGLPPVRHAVRHR